MAEGYMYLGSIIIFIVLFYFMIGVPIEVTDEYSGVVTDKWTELRSSFGSYTVYIFEIDDNSTVKVDDFIYYNYEIGDLYNWSYTYTDFK